MVNNSRLILHVADCEQQLHNIYVSFSVLSSAINMELKEHKEAILDISLRLNPDHYSWRKFAKELGLSTVDIERMYTQGPKESEELYYCALLEWIKLKKDEATFHFLLMVLTHCDSGHLVWYIRKRLGC